MIKILLDSEGENRRHRLEVIKAPFRRRTLFYVSLFLVAVAYYFILNQEVDTIEKLTKSLAVTLSIPIVVWFIMSTKYLASLGSFASAYHVVTGRQNLFTYSLGADAVIEESAISKRTYLYSSFIRHEIIGYEQILIFKNGLIYLPQYAVQEGSLAAFIAKLEEKLTEN